MPATFNQTLWRPPRGRRRHRRWAVGPKKEKKRKEVMVISSQSTSGSACRASSAGRCRGGTLATASPPRIWSMLFEKMCPTRSSAERIWCASSWTASGTASSPQRAAARAPPQRLQQRLWRCPFGMLTTLSSAPPPYPQTRPAAPSAASSPGGTTATSAGSTLPSPMTP